MVLTDKIAVITGGGRGIGREIALAYAKAGANLVLAARSEAAMAQTKADIEALGQEALTISTDISNADSVTAMAKQTLSHYGRVDVLVNNSGVGGPSAPLWEISPEEWQATFDVNVTGTYLCCRAFLPAMIARRAGSIVVIGSITGKRQLLNRTPYAASKTALIGMVRTLAWEIGPYGLRVNIISPGFTEGPRIDWVIEKQAESQGITVEQARSQFTRLSPLNRMVPPTDIGQVAVFLGSDMSSSITGEDMNVAAGVVMY